MSLGEEKMAGFLKPLQTFATVTYPNIEHSIWDNYEKTGQYHLLPSKLTVEKELTSIKVPLHF